ncbi:MAG: hypothetical protein AB3K77_08610 [Methanosarcinaceae archaeon]|uniref:hypothetical protein n=1 Tax=Methanosarcina sp. MTP4 TaxID=1434100 RepID=UPI0012E0470B|nr:hypothetical protein [Methanosarcina sp. MTP4]
MKNIIDAGSLGYTIQRLYNPETCPAADKNQMEIRRKSDEKGERKWHNVTHLQDSIILRAWN